jgi:hypothetical protein
VPLWFARKGGVRRVNLNDTKLTIRISTAAKRKALELAGRKGVSISQLVDQLIRHAETDELTPEAVRKIVAEELRRWGKEKG